MEWPGLVGSVTKGRPAAGSGRRDMTEALNRWHAGCGSRIVIRNSLLKLIRNMRCCGFEFGIRPYTPRHNGRVERRRRSSLSPKLQELSANAPSCLIFPKISYHLLCFKIIEKNKKTPAVDFAHKA